MSKSIITFIKNWRGYAAGETAGFDAATAEALVEAGYAAEAGKKGGKRAAKSGSPSKLVETPPLNTDGYGEDGNKDDNDEKP